MHLSRSYVPFQYSELSGGKVRPAIVVNSAEFQAVEQLYIVAAVTSNVTASSLGHRIVDATSAGLKSAQAQHPHRHHRPVGPDAPVGGHPMAAGLPRWRAAAPTINPGLIHPLPLPRLICSGWPFSIHANGKGSKIGVEAGLNRPAHFRTGFLWGVCHSAMLRQHWRHVTTWRFW